MQGSIFLTPPAPARDLFQTYGRPWTRGHLPSPEKLKSVIAKKTPSPKSVWTAARRYFSVKKNREWLFNTDYFISVYYKIVLLYSYFEGQRGDAGRVKVVSP